MGHTNYNVQSVGSLIRRGMTSDPTTRLPFNNAKMREAWRRNYASMGKPAPPFPTPDVLDALGMISRRDEPRRVYIDDRGVAEYNALRTAYDIVRNVNQNRDPSFYTITPESALDAQMVEIVGGIFREILQTWRDINAYLQRHSVYRHPEAMRTRGDTTTITTIDAMKNRFGMNSVNAADRPRLRKTYTTPYGNITCIFELDNPSLSIRQLESPSSVSGIWILMKHLTVIIWNTYHGTGRPSERRWTVHSREVFEHLYDNDVNYFGLDTRQTEDRFLNAVFSEFDIVRSRRLR